MEPVKFKGFNVEIAKDQDEYLTLPAHIDSKGTVTSCWELTVEERKKILSTGRIYLQILTFGKPLQPQLLVVDNPIKLEG